MIILLLISLLLNIIYVDTYFVILNILSLTLCTDKIDDNFVEIKNLNNYLLNHVFRSRDLNT